MLLGRKVHCTSCNKICVKILFFVRFFLYPKYQPLDYIRIISVKLVFPFENYKTSLQTTVHGSTITVQLYLHVQCTCTFIHNVTCTCSATCS